MSLAATSAPAQARAANARPRLRPLVVHILLGALAGAAIGVIYGSTRPPVSTAQGVVSLAPSGRILGDDTVGDADRDYTAFVQSELIVLNGRTLREAVAAELGGTSSPSYTASQVGTTTIVRLDAEAPTAQAAVDILDAAIAVYSEERESRLRREIGRTTSALDAELDRIQETLAAGPTGAGALQNEYGRLLAQRSGLARAAANVDTAVTVVQKPSAAGSSLPAPQRMAVLGLLLGALAGVGGAMLQRRISRRVESSDDLLGTGVVPLYPPVPRHHGLNRLVRSGGPAATAFRMLVGQVVPAGAGAVVTLFAAERGAGTSSTAAGLAAYAAESDEVLLVLAAELLDPETSVADVLGARHDAPGMTELPHRPLTVSDIEPLILPTRVPGVWVLTAGRSPGSARALQRLVRDGLLEACRATGRTVLLDAPALSSSTVGIEMLVRSGRGVLVVGRGNTMTHEVETVASLVDAQGLSLAGAVLTEPDRLPRRRRRGRPLASAELPDHGQPDHGQPDHGQQGAVVPEDSTPAERWRPRAKPVVEPMTAFFPERGAAVAAGQPAGATKPASRVPSAVPAPVVPIRTEPTVAGPVPSPVPTTPPVPAEPHVRERVVAPARSWQTAPEPTRPAVVGDASDTSVRGSDGRPPQDVDTEPMSRPPYTTRHRRDADLVEGRPTTASPAKSVGEEAAELPAEAQAAPEAAGRQDSPRPEPKPRPEPAGWPELDGRSNVVGGAGQSGWPPSP